MWKFQGFYKKNVKFPGLIKKNSCGVSMKYGLWLGISKQCNTILQNFHDRSFVFFQNFQGQSNKPMGLLLPYVYFAWEYTKSAAMPLKITYLKLNLFYSKLWNNELSKMDFNIHRVKMHTYYLLMHKNWVFSSLHGCL